jgi:hypothetical protein
MTFSRCKPLHSQDRTSRPRHRMPQCDGKFMDLALCLRQQQQPPQHDKQPQQTAALSCQRDVQNGEWTNPKPRDGVTKDMVDDLNFGAAKSANSLCYPSHRTDFEIAASTFIIFQFVAPHLLMLRNERTAQCPLLRARSRPLYITLRRF